MACNYMQMKPALIKHLQQDGKYQSPVVVADAFSIFSIADLSICNFLGTSIKCKENEKYFFFF